MVGRQHFLFEMVPVFSGTFVHFRGRNPKLHMLLLLWRSVWWKRSKRFELVFPRKIGQESWGFPKQTTGRKTLQKTKKKS